jgi:hypothetical protein
MLWEVTPEGRHQNTTSRANFRAWRDRARASRHCGILGSAIQLTGDGEPEELSGPDCTPELFKVLGVDPILGRTLLPTTSEPGSPRSRAQLSAVATSLRRSGECHWQTITLNARQFDDRRDAAEFSVSHQTAIGNGQAARALGHAADADGSTANERGRFLSRWRVEDWRDVDQARAELRTIEARLSDEAPQFNKNYSAEVLPLREQFFGNVRRPLWLMLGAVGFVLLIACANVANLLLSLARRAKKRSRVARTRRASLAHRRQVAD